MKLIIGLGNPAPEYSATRHNAGFLVVDKLARQKKLIWDGSRTGLLRYCWFVNSSGKIELIKPQTFMNESGKAVVYAKRKHGIKAEDIYVIHDDLDVPLGSYKIQFGRGPKDHSGLKSIDEALGTRDYWHVRVGIDNRSLDNKPMGEEYVLQNFSDEERKVLDNTIKQVLSALIDLISK